jgi:hypothetical protein
LPLGNPTTDSNEINEILKEAKRISYAINQENLPIVYTLSSDNFGHAWICAFPDLRGKNLMPCARYVGATIRPIKDK